MGVYHVFESLLASVINKEVPWCAGAAQLPVMSKEILWTRTNKNHQQAAQSACYNDHGH